MSSNGVKKSNFSAVTAVADGSTFDFVSSGQNYKITKADLLTELGATGTIVQAGAVTGTPVLDVSGTENRIRNLEIGAGISGTISAENGIALVHNFTQDTTGLPVLINPTAESPAIASLTATGGISLTALGNAIEIAGDAASFSYLVLVRQASDLAGTLDSSKVYWIDGVVDMGSQSIEVPATGLTIAGFNFDVSQLTSSASGHTLFTSPGGGSGNLILQNVGLETSGATSQIFNLTDATGFNALEITGVNFNNCTSLGTLNGYRQVLESGTGRFGGTPSLTLDGNWVGGYRVTTSLTRSLDNAMSDALFKAGGSLVINGRFRTDMNVDLGTTAPFCDFAPANITNPSTFQLTGCLISRGGVFDTADATILPNISAESVGALFKDNVGIPNTFSGGQLTISTAAATTIAAPSTFYDVSGTFTGSDLDHFDNPTNGQLRNIATNPREFMIYADLTVLGTSGDVLSIKVVKYDDSATSFSDVVSQQRVINNFTGSNDLAFFNIMASVELDQNDYVKLQVENQTAARNVTVQLDSFYRVMER